MRRVFFPTSGRTFLLTRAALEFNVHSLTAGSSLTGDDVFFVMSDFGEDVALEPWVFVDSFNFTETLRDVNAAERDSPRLEHFFVFSTCQSGSWRRARGEGVKGGVVLVAARERGEGVRGIRPPAVRVEKIPVWDFTGVQIVTVAIVEQFESWCREDVS